MYAHVAPQQALSRDKLDTYIPVDYAVIDHEKLVPKVKVKLKKEGAVLHELDLSQLFVNVS